MSSVCHQCVIRTKKFPFGTKTFLHISKAINCYAYSQGGSIFSPFSLSLRPLPLQRHCKPDCAAKIFPLVPKGRKRKLLFRSGLITLYGGSALVVLCTDTKMGPHSPLYTKIQGPLRGGFEFGELFHGLCQFFLEFSKGNGFFHFSQGYTGSLTI